MRLKSETKVHWIVKNWHVSPEHHYAEVASICRSVTKSNRFYTRPYMRVFDVMLLSNVFETKLHACLPW